MSHSARPDPVFQRLWHHAWDAVSLHDTEGRIAYVNPEFTAMLGADPDEITARPVREFVHPDDVSALSRAFRDASGSEEPRRVRYRLRHQVHLWQVVDSVLLNLLDERRVGGIVMRTRPHGLTDASFNTMSQRAAELERLVWRITLEIEAARIVHAVNLLSTPAGVSEEQGLSERQAEVVARLLRGERVPAIAREMFVSPSTVRNHLTAVYRKLGVHSQAELIERLRDPEGVSRRL